jgi:hypothetical protein
MGKTSRTHLVEASPTLDTGAYASGDHMGTLMEFTSALANTDWLAVIQSLTVVDKSKQSAAFTLFLFDDIPTLTSVDNAALDISDSEMLDKCIGMISVGSSDYKALNVNSVACIKSVGLVVWNKRSRATFNDKVNSIWGILMCEGAPTYAADALTLRLGLLQD